MQFVCFNAVSYTNHSSKRVLLGIVFKSEACRLIPVLDLFFSLNFIITLTNYSKRLEWRDHPSHILAEFIAIALGRVLGKT